MPPVPILLAVSSANVTQVSQEMATIAWVNFYLNIFEQKVQAALPILKPLLTMIMNLSGPILENAPPINNAINMGNAPLLLEPLQEFANAVDGMSETEFNTVDPLKKQQDLPNIMLIYNREEESLVGLMFVTRTLNACQLVKEE